MVLIILAPFTFFLYSLVPEDIEVWATRWFTIKAGYHAGVNYYVWIQFIKFLTISILSLWYVSCTYRWRNVLLLSIVFEFNKVLVNIYYANSYSFDNDFLHPKSLIFSIPYIVIIYFITTKLHYYKGNCAINIELNTEINQQITKLAKFRSKDYKLLKKEMDMLMDEKNAYSKKEYLTQFIALRDRLTVD